MNNLANRRLPVVSLVATLLTLLLATGTAAQTNAPINVASVGADLLRPGDVVRLKIWMETDLSGEFPVNEQGFVVLPRIGPVLVTSEPAGAVRRRITAAFGEFLNHESIDVTLLRRVQVLGAVRNPGLYHIDPSMNISDVLALAGGATANGRIDRIELIRDGVHVADDLSPVAGDGISTIRSGDQLLVPEKSWALRNPGVVMGAVSAALSFTLALIR
jgi:polysaccharide biosynthesis/export protein